MKFITRLFYFSLSMIFLSACAIDSSFKKEQAEWKALLGFEKFVPDENAEYTPLLPANSEYKNPLATLPWEQKEIVGIDDLFLELKKISPKNILPCCKITTPWSLQLRGILEKSMGSLYLIHLRKIGFMMIAS